MNILIHVQNISIEFGSYIVWKNISFTLNYGEVLSIVGKNGCGKSTLLKALSGREQIFNGLITHTKPIQIGYLTQESESMELNETVFDFLMNAKPFLKTCKQDLELDPSRLDLWNLYQEKGGFAFEQKIEQYRTGFSFPDDFLSLRIHMLSGGERRLLYIIRLFLQDNDLYLLDEPTNDLDLAKIQFLETEIIRKKNHKKGFIVVSHDRYFLNRITDRILRFHHGTADIIMGNYNSLSEQEVSEEANTKRQVEVIEKSIKKRKRESTLKTQWTQQFKKQRKLFRIKNGTSGIEKDYGQKELERHKTQAIRRVEKEMVELQKTKPVLEIVSSIQFPAYLVSNKTLVSLENASLFCGQKELLHSISLSITTKDRLILMGDNGSGKTTLIQALLGNHPLTDGSRKYNQNSIFFYIPQEIRKLFPEGNLLSHFPYPFDEETVRNYLSANGISGERHFDPVLLFSPGELMKAAFMKAVLLHSDFLFLDEPTNHLDIPTILELENALQKFPGGYLIATHDRLLIQALGGKKLVINQKSLGYFDIS